MLPPNQPSYLHNLITVQPPRSTRSSSLITKVQKKFSKLQQNAKLTKLSEIQSWVSQLIKRTDTPIKAPDVNVNFNDSFFLIFHDVIFQKSTGCLKLFTGLVTDLYYNVCFVSLEKKHRQHNTAVFESIS